MSVPSTGKTNSGRGRLLWFRLFAGVLALFSLAGVLGLGVGAYVTIRDSASLGWAPATFLVILAVTMVLMLLVSIRALRIGSLTELEEQSRSPTFEKLSDWLNK